MRARSVEAPLADIPVGREVREVRLLAKLLDGFANPVRLSVLLRLARVGEASVGELVEAIGAPQPRVSDHLRCLAWCGYVSGPGAKAATSSTP
ncbi:MAG TPA: ArsR family transcriptional regulator [Rubrobacter sp.]|nr:ArsR family transcriptional regulator [Rubrobacter sp.]